MGFFDDLNNMLNRGTEAANRFADTASLKIKLTQLDSKHKELAAQLGQSLYEQVVADPALSAGREQLLADMTTVLTERAQIQAEIERIEQVSQAAKNAGMMYVCPGCGGSIQSHMRFCPACGTPIAQQPAQPQQPGVQDEFYQPVYTQVNPSVPVEPQQPAQEEAASVSQAYEVPQQAQEDR